jgi:hypothetical protein
MQGSVNIGHIIPCLFVMLGDESQQVKESGFFCIEKSFIKNPELVTVNLKKSLQNSFDFQKKVLEKKQNLINTFYPRLYLLIKGKKQLRNKFIKIILESFESEDPEFVDFLCSLLSSFSFSIIEELVPILMFLSGRVDLNASRCLRTVKILTQQKEKLKGENMAQVLIMVQVITLKNYLMSAYNVRSLEDLTERNEKNLQKAEEVPGFDDEYEEFRQLNGSEIEGEELFRLGTQQNEDVGLRKRIKKVVDVEMENEEVVVD